MAKTFCQTLIWPQERSKGKVSLKYIKPTVAKMLHFLSVQPLPDEVFELFLYLVILINDIHS